MFIIREVDAPVKTQRPIWKTGDCRYFSVEKMAFKCD